MNNKLMVTNDYCATILEELTEILLRPVYADLHVHTNHSDGVCEIKMSLKMHFRNGIKTVCDHRSRYYQSLRRNLPRRSVLD